MGNPFIKSLTDMFVLVVVVSVLTVGGGGARAGCYGIDVSNVQITIIATQIPIAITTSCAFDSSIVY